MYNCICVFKENINNNIHKIIDAELRSTHKCVRLSCAFKPCLLGGRRPAVSKRSAFYEQGVPHQLDCL